MTTVGATVDLARTTGKAVTGPSQESTSSTLTLSTSSTDVRGSSSALTSVVAGGATISASGRTSYNSNAPSASTLTLNGGTGRPSTSTNPVDQSGSSTIMEIGMQTSKASGSSRPIPASAATEWATKSTTYDLTTATSMVASSSLLSEEDTRWTTTPDGNGSDQSTTSNPKVKSTTKRTEQVSISTRRMGVDSTTSVGRADDGTIRTSTPSAISTTPDSVSASATATITILSPASTSEKGTSKSRESTPFSSVPSNSMLTASQSGMTTSTTTEGIHGEHSSTTPSSAYPSSLHSTTRGIDDGGQHATTWTVGSSRTTAIAAENADIETGKPNASGSDSISATRSTHGVGDELTTTSYENYLKNIKLNLSLDFNLTDLNREEKKNLEDISNAYGLDPSNDQMVVDTKMKEALQIIAAKMTPELREALGFKLRDMTSSCIVNGDPCDLDNDFNQSFDVDYGNCYTFNYDMPVKYTTLRAGASYGLRMTIMSNSTETLPSSPEEGVKVVVHSQDVTPFPSVEGYKSPVGQFVSLQLTYSKSSKLGAPYGNCSTLESIAKDEQPFYYNGSYSTEGCLRSCFQRNIAEACGCADSRFPSPTDIDVPFCDPLEQAKYKCKEAFIEDNGDYFFVDNCQCYDACEHTSYKSQISQSPWPAGGFFYGAYCPLANVLNFTDCSAFYSENGMTLQVSFAQLGYVMMEEEPTTTGWGLFNNLAGNIDLWVGFTMFGLTEFVLMGIQICLWACRCPKELPEVPSARRRNFFVKVNKKSESNKSVNGDGSATTSNRGSRGASETVEEPFKAYENVYRRTSVVSTSRMPPKNFDNCFGEQVLTRREVRATTTMKQELYDPTHGFESVEPIIAQTSDHAGHFANV